MQRFPTSRQKIKKKKNYESSLYSRKWTVTQQDQYEEKIEHKGPK